MKSSASLTHTHNNSNKTSVVSSGIDHSRVNKTETKKTRNTEHKKVKKIDESVDYLDNHSQWIKVKGARMHNLKNVDASIPRNKITLVTGISGSGKSSLVFDTLMAQAKYHFFNTLSHYDRSFIGLADKAEVKSINGLSLAISLEQIETSPASRATIASFTNIGELLGVIWTRFADQFCPIHPNNLCIEGGTPESIALKILNLVEDNQFCLVIPYAVNKKGSFTQPITKATINEFYGLVLDDKFYPLPNEFKIAKNYKHTLRFVYKVLKNPAMDKLIEYLKYSQCLKIDQIEIFLGDYDRSNWKKPDFVFSYKSGCPECGFSFNIDPRYFSSNSLGRCELCNGHGTLVRQDEKNLKHIESHLYQKDITPCHACHGTGLSQEYSSIIYRGQSMISMHQKDLNYLQDFITEILQPTITDKALQMVVDELKKEIEKPIALGLGHLELSRRLTTLSNGERQRLRLSSILTEPLSSVLYILDEPSQGLHPADLDGIWENIKTLQNLGNTIIIIDHDDYFLDKVDYIIDMGPGGGEQGGEVLGEFNKYTAKKFIKLSSSALRLFNGVTVQVPVLGKQKDQCLDNIVEYENFDSSAKKPYEIKDYNSSLETTEPPKVIFFYNINFRYLRIKDLFIHYHKLNVVSGVSGSGKSTLVMAVIAGNLRSLVDHKKAIKKQQNIVDFLDNPDNNQDNKNNNINEQKTNQDIKDSTPNPSNYHVDYIYGSDFIDDIHIIDRRPMGKSKISIPATYLKCMDKIRDIFAKLPSSQLACLAKGDFSFGSKGACGHCDGKGYISHSMTYKDTVKVKCQFCDGKRYKRNVLQIKYNGLSISDVLDLSIDDAVKFFKNHQSIVKILNNAKSLGLGYLKLGQPSSSLSGGEAQRLKIVTLLNKSLSSKRKAQKELIIIDEPTRGLHNDDVNLLIMFIKKMNDLGYTFVVIEHHQDFVVNADWIIDLGIGPGKLGGKLMFQGSKYQFFQDPPKNSVTYKHIV